MQKVGRNDPCPCGSGKKFKKCCETKGSKRFSAEDRSSQPSALTQLFKSRLQTPKESPLPPAPEKH